MSGPNSVNANANSTMSFAKFDELTCITRKHNKGTLVLTTSGKTKTLSCVKHHTIVPNLTKVSQQQIKDLRTEFSASVREELDNIGHDLACRNPEKWDAIKDKFKAIRDTFENRILLSSKDQLPELTRMDIRAFANDVKQLRSVTVDCLLQLSPDELSRLATDSHAAGKAELILSGKELQTRRDACLDQLRVQIGKCNAAQLESAADMLVKALVPKVDELIAIRGQAQASTLGGRLGLYRFDDHTLLLKEWMKGYEEKLGTDGRLAETIKEEVQAAVKANPETDVRAQTVISTINVLTREVDRQLQETAGKINTALKNCGIKTFSVLAGIDQLTVVLNDESDLGAVRSDVCKLARALGAIPSDQTTDKNGLGTIIRIKNDAIEKDKEALTFREAFGGDNKRDKIIDNLETVRAKMTTINRAGTGDIKPLASTSAEERLASRKDYAVKILNSLRTMTGTGPEHLEARRKLLSRICDDMFDEFEHLVDNDQNGKRKMFSFLTGVDASEIDFDDDGDWELAYNEELKGEADAHKAQLRNMTDEWKASILAKVKAGDTLADMVRQVKEAMNICTNGFHVVFEEQALHDKLQTIHAMEDLAKAFSDKSWNGDWDAIVNRHLQLTA